MPGNPKQRRRKHRGTQTGSIDRRGRTGRPRTRQEAVAQARARKSGGGARANPGIKPPSWRGAITRGLIFAVLLVPIASLFGQPIGGAIVLGVVAAAFYIPLGFYTDRFFYNRRIAKLRREQAARSQQRQTGGRPRKGA